MMPTGVKRARPGILQLHLHFVESCLIIREQMDSAEAHSVRVPAHVNECDSTGPSLCCIHEIAAHG